MLHDAPLNHVVFGIKTSHCGVHTNLSVSEDLQMHVRWKLPFIKIREGGSHLVEKWYRCQATNACV